MNQEVERSKLDTRKAFIEQQLWEQSLQPTPEDIRRRNQELDIRRAANDPPLSEVVSGQALNTLLENIKSMQAKGGYGPNVPLDDEVMKHINLSATLGPTTALLKDGGKLKWPFALRDTPFDADRQKIGDSIARATVEAMSDELSPATVRSMRGSLADLEAKLDRMAPEMSLTDSMQARRYLDELKGTARALEQPTASASLMKKWDPQARSVGELVAYMTKNGLRFSPALQGEDNYYRSLHHSMVTFNYGTSQTARR
jgi:hypothetical protein